MCRHFRTLCLFHVYRQCKLTPPMKVEQRVLKRRYIKFRWWGITQKKEYNEHCHYIPYHNYKKLIKHSLHLLLPLTFASLCLPHKTPSVVSQHSWTPFSTLHFSHLGTILTELFIMFFGDSCLAFREKIQKGMQKMKFQWHVTPHSTVWWN